MWCHFSFTGLLRDRDNIESGELEALKMLASAMSSYDDRAITKAVESGALTEVTANEKDEAVS